MPKISEMIPSNYLKQSDIDQDYIVTVKKLEHKNVARDDEPADVKWLVHFAEYEKPMVLNTTNIQLMAQACGSDDTDDWIGKEVIIYVDPNVSYGGKLVGGLRIRKHQTVVATAPKRAAETEIPPHV
jgi:hypothetical protein